MGMTPQYFAVSSVYTDQLVPGSGALFQTFSTWHPNTFCPYCIYWPSTAFYWPSTTKYQSDCLMTGAVFMILFIKNHIIWFPSVQHCNWFGFRISLSLSREGAIFRDEIENYFSCSRLARRDRDYHMTILVFRDENEIPFCYSHVSRRDRDFRKSFLVVEREKMKLTLVENSRDREFSLTSGSYHKKFLWPKPHILDIYGVWWSSFRSEGPENHLQLNILVSKFVPLDIEATHT